MENKETEDKEEFPSGQKLAQTDAEKFFRKWAPPVVLAGVALWGFFAGGFLAYHSLPGGFIVRIVEQHFPGMVLIPMAAMIALCVVLLLHWTTGTLEFKIIGLDFKGASGPITLWVLCFVVIVGSIKLLWPLESGPVDIKTKVETSPNQANPAYAKNDAAD